MAHGYKVYYMPDKKAESGLKEKVLRHFKRCFAVPRESFLPGWWYCKACAWVESPAMARFDAAVAAAAGTPAAVPA